MDHVGRSRRSVLRALGAAALPSGWTLPPADDSDSADGDGGPILRKLGRVPLSDPSGGYAEGSIRADGRYGVVGSHADTGSFLVDLRDARAPRQVHALPADPLTNTLDVKFDPRDGLYYRTQEPAEEGGSGGVELIDYGFVAGTPTDPQVLAHLETGPTHNVFPHPDAPILYATNAHGEKQTPGLDVWDVSDPSAPERIDTAGPRGSLHDVVVDPARDLAHCAYNRGDAAGYVVLDTSDPRRPIELGRFPYADAPDYEAIGTPGFEGCHYADYDPDRDLAVVGDELSVGIPGGKHVFDVGWADGSPENPVPIGFTHSPNAARMDVDVRARLGPYSWTTHNHDVVSGAAGTSLVSGDYEEGVVLYDLSDPRHPTPVGGYRTDDGGRPATAAERFRAPPHAWSAVYNAERELVFVSDTITGAYTFELVE